MSETDDESIGCPGQHGHNLINHKLDELTKSVKAIKETLCGNGKKDPSVMTRLSLVEQSACSQRWFNRACGLAIISASVIVIVKLINGS